MLIVIESKITGKQQCIDSELWESFYVATKRSKNFKIVDPSPNLKMPDKIEVIEKLNFVDEEQELPPVPEIQENAPDIIQELEDETEQESEENEVVKPKRKYNKRSHDD